MARIILTALLITAGLAGWLTVSLSSSARVRVEPDVMDIPVQTRATMTDNPYFTQANQITKVVIPLQNSNP